MDDANQDEGSIHSCRIWECVTRTYRPADSEAQHFIIGEKNGRIPGQKGPRKERNDANRRIDTLL